MAVYASLLSTIPIPQQQWQTKTQTPVVASVNVGEVIYDDKNSTSITSKSEKQIGLWDRIKQSLVEIRLKKLENIAPEKRTPAQQAEIDANKKALNYMV